MKVLAPKITDEKIDHMLDNAAVGVKYSAEHAGNTNKNKQQKAEFDDLKGRLKSMSKKDAFIALVRAGKTPQGAAGIYFQKTQEHITLAERTPWLDEARKGGAINEGKKRGKKDKASGRKEV
jgi:hypothetical protein